MTRIDCEVPHGADPTTRTHRGPDSENTRQPSPGGLALRVSRSPFEVSFVATVQGPVLLQTNRKKRFIVLFTGAVVRIHNP